MSEQKFYFDSPDGGVLARETSHPHFTTNMTAAFYYDCTNDFSPFGNDDGADLLAKLEEFYQETKGKDSITKWLFDTIDGFGFKYASVGCSTIMDEPTLQHLQEEDPLYLECMNNAIIAAAFGQIKITGQVDNALKELAAMAIKRQLLMNELFGMDAADEHNRYLNQMQADLSRIS